MVIYKATNNVNGKVYIGQTQLSLEKRKVKHIWDAGKARFHFHRALNKYGVENFKWQVICICPNIDSLNEQEQYFINFYDSLNNGYNLTAGGEGILKYAHTPETIKKMCLARAGKNHHMWQKHHSPKTIEKMRSAAMGEKNHNWGKSPSLETKEKLRLAMSGENNHMFGVCGKDNPNYGSKRTSEQRKKMSGENNPNWGKSPSLETIEKMRLAKVGKNHPNWGKHRSPETVEKLRLSNTGENNPNWGKSPSLETREKIRQGHLKYWAKKRQAAKNLNNSLPL